MARMSEVSMFFTSLIAEAIGLESDAFNRFFDEDQQHKLKIIKYPDVGDGVGQGVGPHKDSMLSSYLLQATDHKGLQVQNTRGEWIDCKWQSHRSAGGETQDETLKLLQILPRTHVP